MVAELLLSNVSKSIETDSNTEVELQVDNIGFPSILLFYESNVVGQHALFYVGGRNVLKIQGGNYISESESSIVAVYSRDGKIYAKLNYTTDGKARFLYRNISLFMI